MSGGSPVGGFVRQRHSQGGYSSNGEDIVDDDDDDDDVSSKGFGSLAAASPSVSSGLTRIEVTVKALWIASAASVVYLVAGLYASFVLSSLHSHNRLCVIDERKGLFFCREPLCLGMIAVMLNFLFFFYTSTMAWRLRRFDEKWELTSISALPYITVLGLISFSLLAFALWPIWSFLSIPLLFTLFMATMVVMPSIMIGILKSKNDGLRAD